MTEFEIYGPIYEFVRTVPAGKVVTYGQAAGCVTAVAFTARQVGMALNVVPGGVPWQRVVGAGGALPIHKRSPELALRQRQMLEAEGVIFLPDTAEPRVDMARCQWDAAPPSSQVGLFDAEDGDEA